MTVYVVWGGHRDYEDLVCVRSTEEDALRIAALLEENPGRLGDFEVRRFAIDDPANLVYSTNFGRHVTILLEPSEAC